MSHRYPRLIDNPASALFVNWCSLAAQYSHAAGRRVAVPRAAIDTVAAGFGVPTYARVDLVRDPAGQPCVL